MVRTTSGKNVFGNKNEIYDVVNNNSPVTVKSKKEVLSLKAKGSIKAMNQKLS